MVNQIVSEEIWKSYCKDAATAMRKIQSNEVDLETAINFDAGYVGLIDDEILNFVVDSMSEIGSSTDCYEDIISQLERGISQTEFIHNMKSPIEGGPIEKVSSAFEVLARQLRIRDRS